MPCLVRTAALLSVFALAACGGGGGGGELQLAQMGSFHVGGRDVTISGQPVREVVFTPGGVPARVDPNGTFSVEQAYVQFFIPSFVGPLRRCY